LHLVGILFPHIRVLNTPLLILNTGTLHVRHFSFETGHSMFPFIIFVFSRPSVTITHINLQNVHATYPASVVFLHHLWLFVKNWFN